LLSGHFRSIQAELGPTENACLPSHSLMPPEWREDREGDGDKMQPRPPDGVRAVIAIRRTLIAATDLMASENLISFPEKR
jgi:hypothetical protein